MKYPRTILHAMASNTLELQFALLFAVLLLLSACGGLQPRRDNPTPCATSESCGKAMIEHADNYRIGYVQFDDDGQYKQPGQIDHVINDIRDVADDGLIVISFTHGWKENSGEDRWSVDAFKDMLSAVASREQALAAAQHRQPRTVAGVFFGWPGRSTEIPGLTGLTWFSRQDAALRIAASEDYADALLQLKKLRDEATNNDAKEATRNQLILVGHSLGASMLYQRLIQQPLQASGAIKSALADFVLLLSPAIPTADIAALENLSPADRAVLPPILAITSESDATLRIAFPLGQWLDNPVESDGRLQAMGTSPELVTHRLEVGDNRLLLESISKPSGTAELMQISASYAVMNGHKDISNPKLVEFIAGVTELQIDNRLNRASLPQAFASNKKDNF